MEFQGFGDADFDVFAVPGLEPRMAVLIERVRPKLHALGEALSPFLSELYGEEFFAHVAKHARRSVHPPNDTWVAFAANKRGYKMVPHFQIGLFGTHLFAQFAVIYECVGKAEFAKKLKRNAGAVAEAIPGDFVWSDDHMRPEGAPQAELGKAGLRRFAERLGEVKKAEALCGIRIARGDPRLADGEGLVRAFGETFRTLRPLYELATGR